jgi:hypothetical protein
MGMKELDVIESKFVGGSAIMGMTIAEKILAAKSGR